MGEPTGQGNGKERFGYVQVKWRDCHRAIGNSRAFAGQQPDHGHVVNGCGDLGTKVQFGNQVFALRANDCFGWQDQPFVHQPIEHSRVVKMGGHVENLNRLLGDPSGGKMMA